MIQDNSADFRILNPKAMLWVLVRFLMYLKPVEESSYEHIGWCTDRKYCWKSLLAAPVWQLVFKW